MPFYFKQVMLVLGMCCCLFCVMGCVDQELLQDSEVITEPWESVKTELKHVNIDLNNYDIETGDTIICISDIAYTGDLDTSQLSYSWIIYSEKNIDTVESSSDFALFIPPEKGSYYIDLTVSYDNESVTSSIIVIVVEKQIVIDDSGDSTYTTFLANLPGNYIGISCTNYDTVYIAFSVDENGHFSAYNYRSQYESAFAGTDEDHSHKKMTIYDINSAKMGSGEIRDFGWYDDVMRYKFNNLYFSNDFDSLFFRLDDDRVYREIQLQRVDSLPPRPLPTPKLREFGEHDSMSVPTYKDSVQFEFYVEGDYAIEYQFLPNPEGMGNVMLYKPEQHWDNSRETFTYSERFTVKSEYDSYHILFRATAPGRVGGVESMYIFIEDTE